MPCNDNDSEYFPNDIIFAKPLKCYDKPMPSITICGNKFCLTGEFALGSREAVEQEICKRGGTCIKHPIKSGCTIVVGTCVSSAWAYGDYGTKIENGMRYRDDGAPVSIVSEDHFVSEMLRIDSEGKPLEVQPISIKKANIEMLAALAAGIIADDKVTKSEAEFLLTWLKKNQKLHDQFPVSLLLPRVEAMLKDGVLDSNESKELLSMLKAISLNV